MNRKKILFTFDPATFPRDLSPHPLGSMKIFFFFLLGKDYLYSTSDPFAEVHRDTGYIVEVLAY